MLDIRVSEVVKPDVFRADGLQDLLMGVPEGIRVEHGAGLGRYEQVGTVWVLCVLLYRLLQAVVQQRVDAPYHAGAETLVFQFDVGIPLDAAGFLQVVVELLDPDGGQFFQRRVAQLRNDVVVNVVEIVVLGFLPQARLGVDLVPQLFFADLRGAQHHRASLQKLRAVLRPDRPCQRGVLRPHAARRSVQLPCDGGIPAVDAEAGGRPGVQDLPPGVQAPLCVDQGRAYQRQRVLCVERAGQRAEKEM